MTNEQRKELLGRVKETDHIISKIKNIVQDNKSNETFLFGDGGKWMNSKNFDRNNPNLYIATNRKFLDIYKYFNTTSKIPFGDGIHIYSELLPEYSMEAKSFLHYLKILLTNEFMEIGERLQIFVNPIAQREIFITIVRTKSEESEYFEFESKTMLENQIRLGLKKIFNTVNAHTIATKDMKEIKYRDFEAYNLESDLRFNFECKFVSRDRFKSDKLQKLKFRSLSDKRVERVSNIIRSFRKFLNPSNSRNYSFKREDFDQIKEKIEHEIKEFDRVYNEYFDQASGKDSWLKKRDRYEKGKSKVTMPNSYTKSVLETERNIERSLSEKFSKTTNILDKQSHQLRQDLEQINKRNIELQTTLEALITKMEKK